MNTIVVEAAGTILPPKKLLADRAINSIALNNSGHFFMLTDVIGELRYCFLKDIPKNDSNHDVFRNIKLDLGSKQNNEVALFQNIEFNSSGMILLLWGINCAGIVYMQQQSVYEFHEKNEISPHLTFQFDYIGEEFFQEKSKTFQLVQVRWHPLSGHHVVMLFRDGPLVVIDVLTGDTQEIVLSIPDPFISFCFGHDSDWYRLSIILLTETGDMYVVSPVLPLGSSLSQVAVEELRDWLDEKASADMIGANSPISDNYIREVAAYLDAVCGSFSPSTSPTDTSAEIPTSVRAGAVAESAVLAGNHSMLKTFYRTPTQQGPFRCGGVSKPSKSPQPRGAPCDIAMPSYRGCVMPLAMVSYSSGDIQLFLLDGEIFPRWNADEDIEDHQQCIPLQLVELEVVFAGDTASSAQHTTGRTYITCDPSLVNCFHVVSSIPPRHIVLQVPWLASQPTDAPVTRPTDKSVDTVQAPKPTPCTSLVLFSAEAFSGESSKSVPIVGMALSRSCQFGRIAFIRSESGLMAAINLTAFEQLHSLEMGLQEKRKHLASLRLQSETDIGLGASTTVLQAVSEQLIARARQGISSIPSPMTRGMQREESAARLAELLADVQSHISTEVMGPLNELCRRTQMRGEILRDVYAAQVDILAGTSDECAAAVNASVTPGLSTRLQTAVDKQAILTVRLERLKEGLERRSELAATCLSLATVTRPQCSRAEQQFAAQVREWCAVSRRLEANLSTLQRDVKRSDGRSSGSPSYRGRDDGGSPATRQRLSSPQRGEAGPAMSGLRLPHSQTHFSSPRTLKQSSSVAVAVVVASPFSPFVMRREECSPSDSLTGASGQHTSSTQARITPLILPDEEVIACKHQLKNENDLLLETRDTLLALEEKLATFLPSY